MKLAVMISCGLVILSCYAVSDVAVAEVRGALGALVSHADRYDLEEAALRAGFEVGKSSRVNIPSDAYAPLVAAVSNHWQEVFQNLNSFGTNIVERMLIENTSWYFDDNGYLGSLAMMCDNVETGAVDVAELKLMVINSCYNHYTCSALYRHYQEPIVTNIVHELARHGIMTNWCARILSGQALEQYNAEISSGTLE